MIIEMYHYYHINEKEALQIANDQNLEMPCDGYVMRSAIAEWFGVRSDEVHPDTFHEDKRVATWVVDFINGRWMQADLDLLRRRRNASD